MATAEKPKYHDEAWLREQYWQNGRTTGDISEECGVSHPTIIRWMDKHDIERRNKQEADRFREAPWRDEERLWEMHYNRAWCRLGLSNLWGCDRSTITKWLDKYNIPEPWQNEERLRRLYKNKGMSTYEIADLLRCSRKTVQTWMDSFGISRRNQIETRYESRPWRDKELLRDLHHGQELYLTEIADKLGCAEATIHKSFNDFSLDRAGWVPCGEDHPNWDGGHFPYGEGWHDNKKKQIRLRDQYRCQDCGMTQPEHLETHDEALHVHHLKKARDIDEADQRNAPKNLLTLCRSCHLHKWEPMAPLRPDSRSLAD